MPSILRDRYFLLCLAAGAVIAISAALWDDGSTDPLVGAVSDVSETESGCVFDLAVSDGSELRCFSRTVPSPGSVVEVEGELSDDGGIFYVSSMKKIA